nr:DUF2147 domain-containing protein [Oxalobacteraceae bacterium]
MRKALRFLLMIFLLPPIATSLSAAKTPVGLWVTVDDKTGARRSQVRINESNGVLSGRIEQILEADKRNANCVKCSGPRRNQPVLGMTIIEGVRLNGGAGHWEYGSILDP